MPTFQAMRTVSSAREPPIKAKPSRRSRQWPAVVERAAWRSALGIRTSRAAEKRNVIALIQYAASGPEAATRMPPIKGPMIVVIASIDWTRALALGSSLSVTRFGRPAYTAGRKKPVAKPATPARATIILGLFANGRARKTTQRTQIRRDHQAAARETIDERAGENADRR